MDDRRFDDLAKAIAGARSRRDLVGRIGGLAAVGLGLGGVRRAEAFICREPDRTCRENADCCSALCGPKDATGRRRCLCQDPSDCPPATVCHTVACTAGTCVTSVTPGASCTPTGGGTGTCQGGSCTPCQGLGNPCSGAFGACCSGLNCTFTDTGPTGSTCK